MEKDRVREKGKGTAGTALTSLEGNGEGKAEKGYKWTSVPGTHYISDSWQSHFLVQQQKSKQEP